MHKKNNQTLRLAIGLTLGVVSFTTFAELEEVIVTAQKRDQGLQEVPIVISALSAEVISQRGIDTIEDLGNLIPSLQVATVFSALQVSIRGVGLGLTSGIGENSVAVHYDGAYITSVTAQAMMQNDIETIEVLNGPQGTLWGRNATAGVINYITPKPPEEFQGAVSALGGSFGRYKVEANVGGSVSDNTRVRVSLIKDENDGHIKNLFTGNDVDGSDSRGGRFSLDSDISENLSIAVRTFYFKEDSTGPAFQVDDPNGALYKQVLGNTYPIFPADGPALSSLDPRKTNLGDGDPIREQELWGGSLTAYYDINDNLQLKSLTNYIDYEFSEVLDGDGTTAAGISGGSTIIRPGTQKTFTQELNLIGQSENTDWLVGLFYMKDKPDQSLTAPIGAFGITNVFASDETVTSYAIFADATYSLTEQFRVYGGLRYLEEEREQDRDVLLFGVDVCEGGSPAHFEIEDEATTGRLGVQFDITSDVMAYVQYATGWKSGGLEYIGCAAPPTGAFDPEEVTSIEMGIKASLLDGKMRINAAIFDYDFEALQFEKVIGGAFTDVQNADTSIQGLEMDVLYAPTDSWELSFAVTFLDSEFDEFFIEDQLRPELGNINIEGVALNRTPEWKAIAGVSYFHTMDAGTFTLRGEMIASDDYRLRPYPDYPGDLDIQESYEMYNIYLSFLTADETWEVNTFVKNVSDNDDVKGSVFDGALHYTSYLMPRTWGVELTWNF